MTKACREAKLHDVVDRARRGLRAGGAPADRPDPRRRRLARASAATSVRSAGTARLNSLSLTALKLTVPGVPDIYQGAQRARRFAGRSRTTAVRSTSTSAQAVIRELAALAARPAARDPSTAVAAWLADGDFSRLKLWTIHRLLGWRGAAIPQLFEVGRLSCRYRSRDRSRRHCVAYVRSNDRHGILVVATRLYRELGFPGPRYQPRAVAPPSRLDATRRSTWQAAGIRAVNFQRHPDNRRSARRRAATRVAQPARRRQQPIPVAGLLAHAAGRRAQLRHPPAALTGNDGCRIRR